jgi:hypothetical protein
VTSTGECQILTLLISSKKDNKAITVACNFHGVEETSVLRKDKSGTKISVKAPSYKRLQSVHGWCRPP